MLREQQKTVEGIVQPKPGGDTATAKSKRRWVLLLRLRLNPHSGKQTAFIGGVFVGLGAVVLFGLGFFFWISYGKPVNEDPFTPQTASSVQFPLYYPTRVPTGFHIDPKSVTEPTSGVVVFDAIGPNNKKIYVSEEARPAAFDIGGFYAQLQDLKEIGVSDGAIAVGRTNGGKTEVASRANNQTWTLATTTANVPFSQLTSLLQSLTPNE